MLTRCDSVGVSEHRRSASSATLDSANSPAAAAGVVSSDVMYGFTNKLFLLYTTPSCDCTVSWLPFFAG